MSLTVEERIKKLIVEELGVDASEVKADAAFISDLGADSIDAVRLIVALEEEFEIEIPDEDAETLYAVGDAVDYIKSKVGG